MQKNRSNAMKRDIFEKFVLVLSSLTITLTSSVSMALTDVKECEVSTDAEFFELTAHDVEPFLPSVDENGNTYLQGAALVNAEINHYRQQYRDAPLIRLSMDRYASLTSKTDEPFKNYESRMVVIDPECNELKLFFGNLIGTSNVSFTTYLAMHEGAENLEHDELKKFISQRVKLKPKNLSEIISMLKSDLIFDPNITKATLSEGMLNDLNLVGNIHHDLGGEIALLSFAKKGGSVQLDADGIEVFVIVPQSKKGLLEDNKTLVVLSNGSAHLIPNLNYKLAQFALEHLGLATSIVSIGEVRDRNNILCKIDEVGHWYQMVNGSRTRKCDFNQALIKNLEKATGYHMFDENTYPITFMKMSQLFNEHNPIKVVQ